MQIDTETIAKLVERRDNAPDEMTQQVIESMIQLFAIGLIDIQFDPDTDEPVATMNDPTLLSGPPLFSMSPFIEGKVTNTIGFKPN